MTFRESRLGRAARGLWRRLRGRSLILMYHRVADLEADPFGIAVSPGHFAEQMEVLRRRARPMPLRDLARAVGRNRIPGRAVAVTFDDGYADNLHAARPVLERLDVPATAFIVGGSIGSERGYWWDELEDIVLGPGELPRELRLDLGGERYCAELGDGARYTEEAARAHRGWRCHAAAEDPSPRHRLFRALAPRLQRLPHAAQSRALGELRAWAGGAPAGRADRRVLTEAELARLGAGTLVEVGAHTHHHTMLAPQAVDEQRREMAAGRAWLEERLGRRVESLSYPYGSYSDETLAIVRDLGFASACCSRAWPIWRYEHAHELPRLTVGDWDGDQFARRLGAWLDE